MPTLPTPGGDYDTWGTELNEFLEVSHGPDGRLNSEITATGSGSGVTTQFFKLLISSDDLNQGNPPGTGTKVEGLTVEHHYGGASMEGGRQSLIAYSLLEDASNSTNTDRNYVGIQAVWGANSDDGGTLPGSPQGAGFALSTLAQMNAAATGFLNVTAGDFELVTHPDASCYYQAGIQVGGSIGSNGTFVDTVIHLVCGTGWGFDPIGYTTAIWIGAEHGAPALNDTGTVMKIRGHEDLAKGFDFSGTTFTDYLLSSNGFSLQAPAGNHTIQIGRQDAVASTPYIGFHSSGDPAIYDAQLLVSGGGGSSGQGTMIASQATFLIDGKNAAAAPLIISAITGQTAVLQSWQVNGVPKLGVLPTGVIQTSAGMELTGAGTPTFGSNFPGTTPAAPYKWLVFSTSDGSFVHVPAWK
jgi:hypothetical protein